MGRAVERQREARRQRVGQAVEDGVEAEVGGPDLDEAVDRLVLIEHRVVEEDDQVDLVVLDPAVVDRAGQLDGQRDDRRGGLRRPDLRIVGARAGVLLVGRAHPDHDGRVRRGEAGRERDTDRLVRGLAGGLRDGGGDRRGRRGGRGVDLDVELRRVGGGGAGRGGQQEGSDRRGREVGRSRHGQRVACRAVPPVIFSGIQPTGTKHLGNYIGASRQYVAGQDRGDPAIYCIVDLHAVTVAYDPAALRRSIYDLLALLLASGLDPD